MSALRRGIVALAAVVIVPVTARAADIPLIRVFPPECEAVPVSVDDFVDSLRVELAGRQPHCCVVGPGGDAATDAIKVTLSIEPCDPATEQVDVLVDVAVPPRTVQRQVSLADLPPEARARALALAVAELIRSAGEPGETATGVAAPTGERPLETPPPPRLVVTGSVAGEVRSYFSRDTTLWGARLGLALSRGRWQATVDAGAAANNAQFEQGEVSILLASATLFAGPRFVTGPVVTSIGPTGTLGWAWIKGQSSMPDVVTGKDSSLVGMVGLRAAVEGPAAHVVRVLGYVEAGLTARRLDAIVDDRPATGIAGPYLMLAAGVRFGAI